MLDWLQLNLVALFNVIAIDVVLAGDNAIVVGLAASRVAPELRARVIFWGIAGAVALRILFAAIATQLLAIVGLTLAGGILLLWVCWKMYRELRSNGREEGGSGAASAAAVSGAASAAAVSNGSMTFRAGLVQIIVADVSMSLDNVLAVAGAAKGSPSVLIVGLGVAIVLMAVASHYIASMLARHPWISWLGLAIILYVALDMIWDGTHEIACQANSSISCENSPGVVLRRAFGGA
jgi:YjbE family integral membrane protein